MRKKQFPKQVPPYEGSIVSTYTYTIYPNGHIDFAAPPNMYFTIHGLQWKTTSPPKQHIDDIIQHIWTGFSIPNRDLITLITISIQKYEDIYYIWFVSFYQYVGPHIQGI